MVSPVGMTGKRRKNRQRLDQLPALRRHEPARRPAHECVGFRPPAQPLDYSSSWSAVTSTVAPTGVAENIRLRGSV